MSKIIEVIVTPNGETRVETKGFAGAECQQASRFIELALGTKTSEQVTAEFHQTNPAQNSQEQRNG